MPVCQAVLPSPSLLVHTASLRQLDCCRCLVMITMMALGFLLPAACCLLPYFGLSRWELLFLAVAAARPFRFLVDNFFVLGFVFFFCFFLLLPLRFVLGFRSAFVSSCVHFISFDFLWRWQCAHVCTFDRQSTRRHFICSAARTQPCSPREPRQSRQQSATTHHHHHHRSSVAQPLAELPAPRQSKTPFPFPFQFHFPCACLPASQPASPPACLSV